MRKRDGRWVSQARADGDQAIAMEIKEISCTLGISHQAVQQCLQRAVRSIWRRQVSKGYQGRINTLVKNQRKTDAFI